MAFTATDLSNVEAAMVSAALDGVASVTVAGQSVTGRSLDELRRLRDLIAGDLGAAEMDTPGAEITPYRMVKTVPPGCG